MIYHLFPPIKFLFSDVSKENKLLRLDENDADFVDVIHTDSLPSSTGPYKALANFGCYYKLGHIDFFPNNGTAQPGCSTTWQDPTTSCSHGRARDYFVESIRNPNCFKAQACSSWEVYENGGCKKNAIVKMGMGAQKPSQRATMKYYLYTTDRKPFCFEDTMLCRIFGSVPVVPNSWVCQ